jgi:uncharacterized cupredoxin-like copper-binding protein
MSRAATGGHSRVTRPLRERRRPKWLTWRLAALLVVMTGAIGIAGWHTHSHSHGALQVTAADGSSVKIPEWRVGATADGDPATLPAGELRFELTNRDTVAHDFVLVRTDGPASELPQKDGQVDIAAAGQVAGEVQAFAPGESGEASFQVEPGTYVLFCNIPGHYAGGMYYSLTVQ